MEPHDPTVLIVDDDDEIRRLLAALLRSAGRRVMQASNGVQALEVLRGPVRRPCIILLDMMMPVMNGVEFRKVQLDDPELRSIPVVFFSALAEVVQHAAALGAAGCVCKPFDPDDLVAMLTCRCEG